MLGTDNTVSVNQHMGTVRHQKDTCHEARDLETFLAVPSPAVTGLTDPLCRLATNKDGKVVQGRRRLIAATVLCTIFMVCSVTFYTYMLYGSVYLLLAQLF